MSCEPRGTDFVYSTVIKMGVLEETELSHEFRVTFSMGKPQLFNTMTNMSRDRRRAAPSVFSSDAGPRWFRHMDRNQDGDVSWREFLGTRAEFNRLDADSDMLVSAAEADAATSK